MSVSSENTKCERCSTEVVVFEDEIFLYCDECGYIVYYPFDKGVLNEEKR